MAKTSEKKTPKKTIFIEGLANYAFVHRPDNGNPARRIPPSYKIDVMLDSNEELKKAKLAGLNVKDPGPKHEHPYVTVRSRVQDGRKPPVVVDSDNKPIPSTILIGNGSRVLVHVLPYNYGVNETTAILLGVQVLELVPYEGTGESSSFKSVKGGFTVPASEAEAEPAF